MLNTHIQYAFTNYRFEKKNTFTDEESQLLMIIFSSSLIIITFGKFCKYRSL